MSLSGIGLKGANKILELRDAKGDLELEDLNQVSPLAADYDRTFPLLMGLCRIDPNPSLFLLRGPVLSRVIVFRFC
jgi:hypothetical protein